MNNHKVSNLIINDQTKNELNFPEGLTMNPTIVNGKREGSVEVYTKDSVLWAVLNFHEDKLNGLCEFFYNGLLNEVVTYQNGQANGWGCTYRNSLEDKWFHYKDGKKVSELVKDKDFWIEKEISSGHTMSICQHSSIPSPTT